MRSYEETLYEHLLIKEGVVDISLSSNINKKIRAPHKTITDTVSSISNNHQY